MYIHGKFHRFGAEYVRIYLSSYIFHCNSLPVDLTFNYSLRTRNESFDVAIFGNPFHEI